MHAGYHEAVLQKSELHVLKAYGSPGVVGLAVQPDLFFHLLVDRTQAPLLHEEIERLLAVVEVIDKLAMRVGMPGNAKRFMFSPFLGAGAQAWRECDVCDCHRPIGPTPK